jgi:hypothetical protein
MSELHEASGRPGNLVVWGVADMRLATSYSFPLKVRPSPDNHKPSNAGPERTWRGWCVETYIAVHEAPASKLKRVTFPYLDDSFLERGGRATAKCN